MRTQTYPRQSQPNMEDVASRLILALTAGFLIFIGILVVITLTYGLMYTGKVFPGVTVAGVDISGLSSEQAAARLTERLSYPTQGRLVLQDGEMSWVVSPSDLGLQFDSGATLQQAYLWGRRGGPAARLNERFKAWYRGVNLPPVLMYNESTGQEYLNALSLLINKPAVEASLAINGLDVVVQLGQVGRTLDIPATLQQISAQVQTMQDGVIPLVVFETSPGILDASAQAEIARRILSDKLTLRIPDAGESDPGPWTIKQEDLAGMLTIERVSNGNGDEYQVGLQTLELSAMLEELAPNLTRAPENARFIFNDDTRELELIQDAVIGRSLLIDESLKSINEKLRLGEHDVPLVFDYSKPQITDDVKAADLGIRELVSEHTSYFYGSSASRIQNISTASARFHGVLVPPGATFSMVEVLGDVSLDNGYAEALIIYGDRTIKGVGGGVCQVSTTLFRTVFFGGFPIVERNPHAYRVSYYEQRADGSVNPRFAGLDATVFVPYVDFKFTNDTGSWLLMETYVNEAARTLTWKFYSTSDGRTVEWDTTGPKNVEDPPKPDYNENPELARGEIKQVDWEAEGADITVSRTVYRDGQVLHEDTIYTHYLPWRAVYEYGPGTKIPNQNDRDEDD